MSEMSFRRLGESGLSVSVIGLGCNNFGGRIDQQQSAAVVNAAIDAGITLFDTADSYGGAGRSEEILGAVLRSTGRRDGVLVATKFGTDLSGANGPDFGARGGRRYIVRAAEASLRRLGTDWIDLYQMHVPDPATPIDETLAALDDLVRAGKVRYVGHSNFSGWQTADAAWVARTAHRAPFVSAQNEYSLLNRAIESDLIPACQRFGVGVLPYFPLASGLLTGKYRRGEPAPEGSRLARDTHRRWLERARWDTIDALDKFAAERGRALVDIAIGWLLAQPTVASVIAGATTPEQVRANVAAGGCQPSTEDLATLDTITRR